MSTQDQLADAPEGLRRIAAWLDAQVHPGSRQAGANQDDLRRWADAIEQRQPVAFEAEVWKFVLGVSLGMVATFIWGWVAAGGPL